MYTYLRKRVDERERENVEETREHYVPCTAPDESEVCAFAFPNGPEMFEFLHDRLVAQFYGFACARPNIRPSRFSNEAR